MTIVEYILKKLTFTLSVLLLIFISCETDDKDQDKSGLKNIHIGLYTDNGAAGVEEVRNMLQQLGCTYSAINKDSILTCNLSKYDIILFPGGDMWVYRSHLTSSGVKEINDYVRLGGGYFGICAGSYFAADKIVWRGWADEPRKYFTNTGLGIFSGTADGPVEEYAPAYQDNNCKVIINQTHPITHELPEQLEYLYSFGPKFIIEDSSNVSILGKSASGINLVLSVQYEQGRVFLTSLHPEFDKDKSSWEMISNALLWCSDKL